MNFKNGIKFAILLGVIVLSIAIFVMYFINPNKSTSTEFQGTYLPKPKEVNAFSLIGIDHKPFDNASLKGKWTLVFFGFTHCNYVCPTTMAELAKMYRKLEERHVEHLPQIVMISVDPANDDLKQLAKYVTSFHPSFYAARGEEKAIQAMTHEMGITYIKAANNNLNDKNYDIQHGGAIVLFNPQGELNAFFTTPHHADSLVKDYVSLTS